MMHHADCDGYRFEHAPEIRRVTAGSDMRRARCRCGWTSPIAGPGVSDRELTRDHPSVEVVCDGRCRDWT